MTLFAELKRRNVFRVGAAYVVVSWLILQVVDVVAGTGQAAFATQIPETVTFSLVDSEITGLVTTSQQQGIISPAVTA